LAANNIQLSAFHSPFILILGDGSCDFEVDFCGWHEDSGSNDSQWRRTMGRETATTLKWWLWGKFAKPCQAI
jgi:hypothetical protein